jgi:hypothetical protein
MASDMPAAECSDTATTTTTSSRGSREDCLINHDMINRNE